MKPAEVSWRRFYGIFGSLLLAASLLSCFKDPEENKLYILSVADKKLHVLSASNLSPIISQPLDFSGMGTPSRLTVNPALHQIMVTLQNSNTLVRIRTEPDGSFGGYTPLSFMNYGSGEPLVAAIGNPAKTISMVLTNLILLRIDGDGLVVGAFTATPTPTAVPTATATPTSPTVTPTASPTPGLTGQGFVTLPAGCGPSDMAVNLFGQEKPTATTSATATPTTSPSPSTSTSSTTVAENSSGSGGDVTFIGGDQVVVACRDSSEVVVYSVEDLSLQATIALNTDARPYAVNFIRTAGESGDTVTGAYAIWNEDRTLDLVSSSSLTRLTGSPFTITSTTGTISSFAKLDARGLVLTGYGTSAGGFVDIRDLFGTPITGSPFTLPIDCQITGPGGLFAEDIQLELSTEQKDLGLPEQDVLVYYTCPTTGIVGGYSTNQKVTFLSRVFTQTQPRQILSNAKRGIVYVTLTGSVAPAPGIVALDKKTLTNAFIPAFVTLTAGTPDQLFVSP